jgi:NTE family protein
MMQGTIARQKLAAYPPDYLVQIPRNACGMLDFDLSDKMIALGMTLAQEQLGHLVKE